MSIYLSHGESKKNTVHIENISDEKVIKVVEKYDHIILDCNKVINYMIIPGDYLSVLEGLMVHFSNFRIKLFND